MANLLGKLIGKVRIERLIGRGGMAEVYLGRHTTLDRPVAVKMLTRLADSGPGGLERFQREARAVASLRHPNIVTVFDFDLHDDQPYIVMEYVDGPSLAAYLSGLHESQGRMPIALVARLIAQTASALDYAHRQGMVHRDVKPGNILLSAKSGALRTDQSLPRDVEAILTDFGLVRLVDSGAHSSGGVISGTPAYMSPEQARGERVDGRSDVYSLGVVLYELLAGRVPFDSESMMATLVKHLNETPPAVPGLPQGLQSVLDRALQKDPALRYQTAGELADALLAALGLPVSEALAGRRDTPQFDAGAPTLPPTRPPATPSSLPLPTRARKTPRAVWIAAAGVAALILIGAGLIRFLPRPAAGQPAASATVVTPMLPFETLGQLRFHDVTARLDEVTLTAFRLDPAPAGFRYEAWLASGEERRSIGILSVGADGSGEMNFIDPQGRNLLARYDRLEISLEADPDPSPNPSGTVYSSAIPSGALTHIRHLLVGFPNNPNQTPMVYGLLEQTTRVDEQAGQMLSAYQSGDAAGVLRAAEALHNLLVGSQGADYGDLDGDGQVSDPGDGFGLLLNGDNSGYILGTYSHAEYAAGMSDATENIQLHAEHVMVSADNVEHWAAELRELVIQVAADPLAAENAERIRQAIALSDRMLNGRDLNGNERIEAIPDEGGARTAADHAYYLADMPVMAGAGQMPPPGPPFATPSAPLEYHTP